MAEVEAAPALPGTGGSRQKRFYVSMSSPVVCLQAVAEDVLERVGLVTSLRAWHTGKDESSSVHKVLESAREVKSSYSAAMERRTRNLEAGDDRVVRSPEARRAAAGTTDGLAEKYRLVRSALEASIGAESQQMVGAFAELLRAETTQIHDQLENALHELVARGDCPTLRALVRERTAEEASKRELVSELAQLRARLAKLQAEAAEADETLAAEAEELRREAEARKHELARTRSNLEVVRCSLADAAQARLHAVEREHAGAEGLLRDELAAVQLRASREDTGFAHTRSFLAAKTERTRRELEEWNERYEAEVTTATAELETLTARRESGLERLKAAEQRYRAETESKGARDRVERELVEREERGRASAAVAIQAVWRGHAARRVLAAAREASSASAAAPKRGKRKGKKKA